MTGDLEVPGACLGGRPALYKPAYCRQVLDLGRLGYCKAEIAAWLGVANRTLDNWAKAHAEFRDAIRRARALEYAWWLDAGRKGMLDKNWNLAGWELQMKNRFGRRFMGRGTAKQRTPEPKETIDAGRIREDMERKLSRIAGAGGPQGIPTEPDLPAGW